MTSGAKADGRFGKQDFVYLPTEDVYRCRDFFQIRTSGSMLSSVIEEETRRPEITSAVGAQG